MLRRLLLGLIPAVVACALLAATAAADEDCPDRYVCEAVVVPLDRSGAVPGRLSIPVMVQKGDGPVLLALGGGPGQGMIEGIGPQAAPILRDASGLRVAFLDQRGTGAGAIDCPAMQRAALTDFTVPPPGSVLDCGRRLGVRRGFYSTTDTVADLEQVRVALGLQRWALLGVSYGTYVAERYARAHPDRVSHLVLDSVVPQEDVDPFFAATMRHSATILRQLCAKGSFCAQVTRTPVVDLHRLVTRTNRAPLRGEGVRIDGPALFDLLASLSSFQQALLPTFPLAVKRALRDHSGLLLRLAAGMRRLNQEPNPAALSWGLHTATICADVSFPWGSPAGEPVVRPGATRAAAARLPRRLGPFDRTTAATNGLIATCGRWPSTSVAPPPEPGPLPQVPILVLAGTWDLSTPVHDARREARRSPTAQLAVLPQVGHATLFSAPCALRILRRFFAGRPLGRPCAKHRAPLH